MENKERWDRIETSVQITDKEFLEENECDSLAGWEKYKK